MGQDQRYQNVIGAPQKRMEGADKRRVSVGRATTFEYHGKTDVILPNGESQTYTGANHYQNALRGIDLWAVAYANSQNPSEDVEGTVELSENRLPR